MDSRVFGGISLIATACSCPGSVGTFKAPLEEALATVDIESDALEDTEDFLVSLFTDFRFGGGGGGRISLPLDRKQDKIAAATSDCTLALALVRGIAILTS